MQILVPFHAEGRRKTMKCLSLNQPFGELIVRREKTIELRTWATKHRGEFLIHAAKKIMASECERFKINPKTITTGAIIGQATIYDVKNYDWPDSDWVSDAKYHLADPTSSFFSSKKGFLLKDAVKFPEPIPYLGQLQFFDVELICSTCYFAYGGSVVPVIFDSYARKWKHKDEYGECFREPQVAGLKTIQLAEKKSKGVEK